MRSSSARHLLTAITCCAFLHIGAHAQRRGGQLLGNQNITALVETQGGHLTVASVEDRGTHAGVGENSLLWLPAADLRKPRQQMRV
jgi:hypothetical protein